MRGKWREVAEEYLKVKNPAVNAEDHIKRKLIDLALKTPSKTALFEQAKDMINRRRCDVSTLMQICDNFAQSMAAYQAEFAEQTSTLIDDAQLAKQYHESALQVANDSKKEA